MGADPGTAKGADITLAAKLIRSHTPDPADRFHWIKPLLTQQDFNGHQLGLVMLSDVFEQKPKEALRLLQRHADSSNWVVREYAGTCAGRILDQQFAAADVAVQEQQRGGGRQTPGQQRARTGAVFDAALPHRDERLFVRCRSKQPRFGVLGLEVTCDGGALTDHDAVVQFKAGNRAERIDPAEGLAVLLALEQVDLHTFDVDRLFGVHAFVK